MRHADTVASEAMSTTLRRGRVFYVILAGSLLTMTAGCSTVEGFADDMHAGSRGARKLLIDMGLSGSEGLDDRTHRLDAWTR